MSLTITNRILSKLIDLAKNVVNGALVLYDEQNENNVKVFTLTGSFALDVPQKIESTVTNTNEVTFSRYVNGVLENQVTTFVAATPIALFDTGFNIQVDDLSLLVLNDSYEFRMNDSTDTILDVSAYKKGFTDRSYPYLAILPVELPREGTPDRRTTIKGKFVAQLWVDYSQMHSNATVADLIELAGDVENEFMRNRRLKDDITQDCLVIDTDITNGIIFSGEGSESKMGFEITLNVLYRHSTKDTRSINP